MTHDIIYFLKTRIFVYTQKTTQMLRTVSIKSKNDPVLSGRNKRVSGAQMSSSIRSEVVPELLLYEMHI